MKSTHSIGRFFLVLILCAVLNASGVHAQSAEPSIVAGSARTLTLTDEQLSALDIMDAEKITSTELTEKILPMLAKPCEVEISAELTVVGFVGDNAVTTHSRQLFYQEERGGPIMKMTVQDKLTVKATRMDDRHFRLAIDLKTARQGDRVKSPGVPAQLGRPILDRHQVQTTVPLLNGEPAIVAGMQRRGSREFVMVELNEIRAVE